ncbi:MAG: ribonuclease HII [Acidobacteria bacterium]|nr:ribonuclease HII [Acidobacteriota bacterium]
MRCTRRLENLAYAAGRRCVAGVDEVGRGALFGPVVAAAVVLGSSCRIAGIDDSKRLSPAARAALEKKIRAGAVAWSVAAVDAARIDRINIYQASRQAMRDAVLGLDPRPDLVLVDALRLDLPWEVEQRAIIHGDARSISIAAASILAKVHRDRLMEDWDRVFPQYRLARNKGYGTAAHLRALREFGVTPEHRRSYRPVAARSLFPVRTEERDEPLSLFPE